MIPVLSPALWQEITPEQYRKMREILPPVHSTTTAFLLGEPFSHRKCGISGNTVPVYDGYLCFQSRYYATTEALGVEEFKKLVSEFPPDPKNTPKACRFSPEGDKALDTLYARYGNNQTETQKINILEREVGEHHVSPQKNHLAIKLAVLEHQYLVTRGILDIEVAA